MLQRPIKKIPGSPVAPELSDLVNYMQAAKFKVKLTIWLIFSHYNLSLTKILCVVKWRKQLISLLEVFITLYRSHCHSMTMRIFQGFPGMVDFVHRREESSKSLMLGITRTGPNLLPITTPTRRLRNAALPNGENKLKSGEETRFSSTSSSRPNSNASCYQVTSLNESSARKLSRWLL